MNKHLIIIAGLFLVLGFQNCSNTASFNADGVLVAKTDVSLQDDGTNTYDGVIDEVADEMPSSNPPSTTTPPSAGGGTTAPSPTPYPGNRNYTGRDDDKDYDHDDKDYDHDDKDYSHHDDKDDNDYDVDHDDDSDHSKATHVCVLESGPGKSVRLGRTAGALSNDTSAVNDVCMSEKACLETVSKAFEVKGAEKRGYCKESSGNSKVVRMSDKEVQDAIAGELLKRIMSSN